MGIGKFFKSIASAVTKPLNKLGVVGDIGLAALGAFQPELLPYIAGAKGAQTYGNTGKFLPSLASAGATYAGAKIAGNTLGDLGTVGSNIGSAANSLFGQGTSNSLAGALARSGANTAAGGFASNLLSTPISSLAGNAIGSSLASSLAGNQSHLQQPAAFRPTRADEQKTPNSLQGFGSLNQDQQLSNIATKGVYGTGLGPQENQYFLNLVNRRLVDESGGVGDVNNLDTIDRSYLSQLGFGGYNNSNDLLEAIGKWQM